MMRTVFALLPILLISACATNDASAPAADQSAAQSIAAPTPEGVVLALDADDDGQNVTVKKGMKFSVELIGAPTAGLMWTVTKLPSFLEKAGEFGGPTSTAQLQEGFAGGSHWEGFAFNVTGTGEGELRLEQRSAFGGDDSEPPLAAWSAFVFAEE